MCAEITMIIMIMLCTAGVVFAAPPQGVDLADMKDWDIVVCEKPGPSETYAAEEFRDHFTQASGVTLPIVDAGAQPVRGRRHVFIGEGEAMRASGAGFGIDDMGDEDLRIVVRDDFVVIAGGRARGTLYGVYTFLEDYLGVRFLTADHTHVPPVGQWRVVGPVDRIYRPPLSFRWSYYGELNAQPAFAARMRCNTTTHHQKYGGIARTILVNHSFTSLLPTTKYGQDHPEYYSLVDGRRRNDVEEDAGGEGNEPCLTNPDVLRIVTEAVLDEIARHPQRDTVSVSQNDNAHYCRCENCAAIDEREGTPMGSLLTFVNAVADEVAKKHPDVKVGTLAYWYSRRPPKTIRPRDNVLIQLASIECSITHAINDPNSKLNVEFCQDLERWGQMSKQINVWNYNTNFKNYLLPCPNLRTIEPNVRFFVANNVKGLFMQAVGNATGGELSDLRNYLICRLLWDPNQSGQRIIDEFLDLHYQSAAPPIRRFIHLVHDQAEAGGIEQNCFATAAEYALDEQIARAGLVAFDEALGLADNHAVRARVEKASVCAYRLAVEEAWKWVLEHEDELDEVTLPDELAYRTRPLLRRLFDLCERYGINRWHEWNAIDLQKDMWRRAYSLADGETF